MFKLLQYVNNLSKERGCYYMARTPRRKSSSNIHHIMSRSISEIQLFREASDKDKFLDIVRKYKKIYMFIVYSFVIMDTHYHLQIHDNGADVSKLMKSINQSYAQYYNRKYQRHGHVFADRFKSKPIEKDSYAITTSAYIHNNPKDIKGYDKCVHKYTYSSLKTYLGFRSASSDIVDIDFILQYFSNNVKTARKSYLEFLLKAIDSKIEEEIEFTEKEHHYVKEKHLLIRDFKPENILNFVLKYTDKNFCFHAKYNHKSIEFKSICVLLMRSFCDFSLNDISNIIGNVTNSNIWRLCEKGILLVNTNERYKNIVSDFINYNKSA